MDSRNSSIELQKEKLIEISRYYGNNPEYIIAGGGNTSYKTKEKLWIKASGVSMADIDEDGFVCLSREKLKIISTKSYSQNSLIREPQVKGDLQKAIISPSNKRPSVETSLHELMDFAFVVHTHPTLVNALMCSRKAKRSAKKLFGRKVLFIEYTDPGYVLYKKVEEETVRFRDKFSSEPSVIYLQNHGVIVGGNTIDEIKEIYVDIEKKIRNHITLQLPDKKTHPSLEYAKKISSNIAAQLEIAPSNVLFRTNGLIQYFVQNNRDFEKVDKPFTPDDIVYCRSDYLFTSAATTEINEVVDRYKKRHGSLPKIIALQGKGLIAIDESEKSARIVMDIFENMMKVSFYSESFGGPQFMNPEQIDFIDNWEVENYRRKVSMK